jgi:hypothetical protein
MCDIRRGRATELRSKSAAHLVEACIEVVGLRNENVNVEFTQHAGDEMDHTLYGGLSNDLNPDEPDTLVRSVEV